MCRHKSLQKLISIVSAGLGIPKLHKGKNHQNDQAAKNDACNTAKESVPGRRLAEDFAKRFHSKKYFSL